MFLHPEQKQIVERCYNGPARVSGSAGTGKTVVALHRAAYLASIDPDTRVLLTTFSDTLAASLRTKVRHLLSPKVSVIERIDVYSLDEIGMRLYKANLGRLNLIDQEEMRAIVLACAGEVQGHIFKDHFLFAEWDSVVDAWQIETWEEYRDVRRLGRKTRLPEAQRAVLWSIFERVRAELRHRNTITKAEMFTRTAEKLHEHWKVIYDHVVVDEAQDLTVYHLSFLNFLSGDPGDSLFFAGDLGQRIFQQPFSWMALGIDVRGRSRSLRVNYRTSHQIRSQADRLLEPEVSDVDGNVELRGDTVSVFNGQPPIIVECDSDEAETVAVAEWLSVRIDEGVKPEEIGIFVRSQAELNRARAAAELAGLEYSVLDSGPTASISQATICTMHLAKGLEFRAVVVMACDDEVIPLQSRIESVGDESDLKDVYETERHLLYVACTRARDFLLVAGIKPVSEFLADMGA